MFTWYSYFKIKHRLSSTLCPIFTFPTLYALNAFPHPQKRELRPRFFPLLIISVCYHCFSLLGAIFPLPRILYAMANDGLLFKFLANINKTTKTPLISTVICGVCAGKITDK